MDRHAADMNGHRGEARNVEGSGGTQRSVQMAPLVWLAPSPTGGPSPMEMLVPWLEEKYPRFINAGRHERAAMVSMLSVEMQRAGHESCRYDKILGRINLLRDEARREAHPDDRKRPSHGFRLYKRALMKAFGFSRTSRHEEADLHLNDERDTSDGDAVGDEGSSGNRMEIDLDDSLQYVNAGQYDAAPVGWTERQQAPPRQWKPNETEAANTISVLALRQDHELLGFTAEDPIVIDDDELPHASTVGVAAQAAQSAAVAKEECPPLEHPRVPTSAARTGAREDAAGVILSALADAHEILGDTRGTRRENESIYGLSRAELAIEQFMDNLASSYAVADRVRFTQLLATNVSAAMLYCRLDAASQRHFVDEVLAGKTVFNK